LDRTHASALLLAACCTLLLAACGSRDRAGDAARQATGDVESLPRPEAGNGSITGMPDKPGPGAVGSELAGATTSVPPLATGDALPLPPPDAGDLPAPPDATQAPSQPSPAQASAEPTPADAAAVIASYYAAIAASQYPRAYALWSGGGQASGQTAQQFAAGFADTASVSVEVGAPGRVDAAAGSRYVEIPVSVAATRRDGSVHRYAGAYTLRRAVVDGASAEQRAWRIASADLREVRP
jgi:hypothetical protein